MSDDFHGFSVTSSFLRVILNGSSRQIASKHVHSLNLVWFREIVVRKPLKLRQTSSLEKSSFGFMHKLCWLNAQISCCLANEVLPLEGGKFVFCCFLATKTVCLDVLRTPIFVDFCMLLFEDFRGFSMLFADFHFFSSFLRVILTASRKQFVSKHVHFMDLVWIRAIFG